MDKNTIIGFLLIGALLIGFSMYNSDDETAKPALTKTEVPAAIKEVAKVDAPMALTKGDSSLEVDSVRTLIELETLKKDFGLFYQATKGTQEELMVENDKLKIWFSNKGGYISKVELKGYHTFADRLTKKNDLNLFSGVHSIDSIDYEVNDVSMLGNVHTINLFYTYDTNYYFISVVSTNYSCTKIKKER